jgi:hypothetical protein
MSTRRRGSFFPVLKGKVTVSEVGQRIQRGEIDENSNGRLR